METHNHVVLKMKAVEWLYLNQNCKYIATEVKIGKYILDVVGSDGRRVFIIEAKQDKSDFLKDCNDPADVKKLILEYKEKIKETGNIKKYKKLIKRERNKSVKFQDKALERLSSHRYIITPDGLIDEVPEKWGLLNEEPRVKIKCKGNRINLRLVEKIVRDIAKKQTKLFLKTNNVDLNQKPIKFPVLKLI